MPNSMNKSWPAIVAQYSEYSERSPAFEAMLMLSKLIAFSGLAKGLFGWTSMFDP